MTAAAPHLPTARWVRAVIIVAVILVALSPVIGAPMPAAWLAAGAPWVLVLRARGIRSPLAVASSGALVFLLLFVVLIVTALVHLDPLVTLAVVYAVTAAAGALFLGDLAGVIARRPDMTVRSVLTALAPFAGAVVWFGTQIVSTWTPRGSEVAWATLNDAANSLMFGRQIIIDGGVRLGVEENPVPFVASIIASMTLPGRPTDGAVAAHDVFAFVSTWSLLIAALCVTVGLLSRQLLRDASATVSILGPALASLLPLSWMISGLSFEYGYINVPPTLLLLAGSLIAFFASREAPALSFAVTVASGALMMASWSPLTLMPALLAMLVLIRHLRAIWAASVAVRAMLGILILLVIAFAIVVVLPTFGASQGAIVSDVSFYPFRIRHLLVLLAVASVLAVFLWWKRREADAVLALAAIGLGGGAAIAVFLYARRNEAQLWAYYSYKALWFLLMILLILATVFAVAVVAHLARRVWVGVASLVAIGLGTIAYGAFANHVPNYGAMNAVSRILTGTVLVDNAGDEAWNRIIQLADGRPHGILWHSSDPNEVFIDFWLIKLASPGFDDEELHVMAYTVDPSDVEDLCRFAELSGPALRVVTGDEDLEADLQECGNSELVVEMER